MENTLDIPDLLIGQVFTLVLVALRVGAAVSLLPAFGEQSLPARLKLGIALALSLVIMPAVPAPGFATFPEFLGLAAAEITIGFVLGLAIRLFVLALQTAGTIAAQATSLSQILGGLSAEPMPAMGHLLVLSGLTLAVISGLHVHVVEYLMRTYDLFPTGVMPVAGDVARWGTGHVASVFTLAFSLSAPFVIASLIYNLALGVINRAMPQLMVAFVGAPFITFGGLFLLFAGAPLLLRLWNDAMFQALVAPMGAIR